MYIDEIHHSDCTDLPLLSALVSANEDGILQVKPFWVYGGASKTDYTDAPFLFINEGAATMSGSPLRGAIIRDLITQDELQLLEHPWIHSSCPLEALSCGRGSATANRLTFVMVRFNSSLRWQRVHSLYP